MLRIPCDCGARLKLPPECIGRSVACSKCQRVMRAVSGGGEPGAFPCRLTIQAGPERAGEQLLLGGDATIEVGKLEGKQIRLSGQQVSRNHCRLLPTIESGWFIEDNNSTNGIFVNGSRVQTATLSHGDRVRIGDFEFAYTDSRVASEEPEFELLEASASHTAVALSATPRRSAAQPQDLPPQDDLYDLAEEPPPPVTTRPKPVAAIPVMEGGPTCPSCSASPAEST
jgi:predicted component of type VI protein secretion system